MVRRSIFRCKSEKIFYLRPLVGLLLRLFPSSQNLLVLNQDSQVLLIYYFLCLREHFAYPRMLFLMLHNDVCLQQWRSRMQTLYLFVYQSKIFLILLFLFHLLQMYRQEWGISPMFLWFVFLSYRQFLLVFVYQKSNLFYLLQL